MAFFWNRNCFWRGRRLTLSNHISEQAVFILVTSSGSTQGSPPSSEQHKGLKSRQQASLFKEAPISFNSEETQSLLFAWIWFPHFLKGNFNHYLFKNFIYLFIYLFIFGCVGSLLLLRGRSLLVVSGSCSSLQCAGFSLWWLLLLRSTGSRRTGCSSCDTQAQ